jgi:hypothetical protein
VRQIGLLAARYCCIPLRNKEILRVGSRREAGKGEGDKERYREEIMR